MVPPTIRPARVDEYDDDRPRWMNSLTLDRTRGRQSFIADEVARTHLA